jgi:hypothetical protein
MENTTVNSPLFDEEEWLRLLFLLNDTQCWLNELVKNAVFQVPIEGRRKLFRKTYYLTVTSLAHIMERHYYKVMRHPNTGKFTIPVPLLLSYIRDAASEPTSPVPGSLNFQRVIEASQTIGFDREQKPTKVITVLTEIGGRVITAFPGRGRHISIHL